MALFYLGVTHKIVKIVKLGKIVKNVIKNLEDLYCTMTKTILIILLRITLTTPLLHPFKEFTSARAPLLKHS